jgi:hypothetical protein
MPRTQGNSLREWSESRRAFSHRQLAFARISIDTSGSARLGHYARSGARFSLLVRVLIFAFCSLFEFCRPDPMIAPRCSFRESSSELDAARVTHRFAHPTRPFARTARNAAAVSAGRLQLVSKSRSRPGRDGRSQFQRTQLWCSHGRGARAEPSDSIHPRKATSDTRQSTQSPSWRRYSQSHRPR